MILWILCIILALMALILLSYALRALRKKYILGAIGRILSASLLLCLSALAATLSMGIRGYQALTQEKLAATVSIQKIANQRFKAQFMLPNTQQQVFELAGDEILVDAHILKWHPWANILGLHTSYQLERISGRYTSIDDEQTEARTVYSLSTENSINLFELSKRVKVKPFLDAQYGSSTFVPIQDNVTYEIRVSTAGLLIRQRD